MGIRRQRQKDPVSPTGSNRLHCVPDIRALQLLRPPWKHRGRQSGRIHGPWLGRSAQRTAEEELGIHGRTPIGGNRPRKFPDSFGFLARGAQYLHRIRRGSRNPGANFIFVNLGSDVSQFAKGPKIPNLPAGQGIPDFHRRLDSQLWSVPGGRFLRRYRLQLVSVFFSGLYDGTVPDCLPFG